MRQESSAVTPRKRLVVRLSSLGDVILGSSALWTDSCAHGVDWVVAREYAAVLRGHPRIRKLWEFDRRADGGFSAWVRFAGQIWDEQYDEVIDLHGTIRAQLLRFLFLYWRLTRRGRAPRWKVASKQRFASWGFIIFKKAWPARWRSRLQVEIFSQAVGGTGRERPDLRHLLCPAGDANPVPSEFRGRKYLCVMPGSNWPGKTWAAKNYLEVLKPLGIPIVVLGTSKDSESLHLVEMLKNAGVPCFSGVDRWDLAQVATVLASAHGYLGSDTGMAHLAEAVGTEILVIYGPTAPGLGFEPWRCGSRTAGATLWCRPCGKIGNRCYRPFRRFLCVRGLSADAVMPVIREKFANDTL